MKLGRFKKNTKTFYGVISDNRVFEMLNPFENKLETIKEYKLEELEILVPTIPTKIVCVGLNYVDHAKELNMKIPDEPIIFLKPSTSVIGNNEDIIYPISSKRVDYEAELAVVIKKKCRNIDENEVENYILGYTCFNDITARDLQKKDIQWTRAKSFDTFAPLGPYVVEDKFDPNNLEIKMYKNGEIVQSSNTENFIFKIEKIVSFISKIMTLLPGDVITTGTPPGVGEVKIGDELVVEIEKIGRLKNRVLGEKLKV